MVRVLAWEFRVCVLGMMAEDGHALCSENMVGMVESMSTQLLGGITS